MSPPPFVNPIDFANALMSITQMKTDISNMKNQISSLQNDNGNLKNQVSSLQTDNGNLKNQVNALQTASANVNNQLTTINNQITVIKNDITTTKNQLTSLSNYVNGEIKNGIASLQTRLNDVKTTADSAMSKINSTTTGLSQTITSTVNKNYVLGLLAAADIENKIATAYPDFHNIMGKLPDITKIPTMNSAISGLQSKMPSAYGFDIKALINDAYIKGFINGDYIKGFIDGTFINGKLPSVLTNMPSDALTVLTNARNFKSMIPTINTDIGTFQTNILSFVTAFKAVLDNMATISSHCNTYSNRSATDKVANLYGFLVQMGNDAGTLYANGSTLRGTLDALGTAIQKIRGDFA